MNVIFKAVIIALLLTLTLVFHLQGSFLLLVLLLTVIIIWLPTKHGKKKD